MELTVTDGDGIPQGSILSIKCGAVHCQSVLELGRPIYVPCNLSQSNKKPLSIGLLQEVCRENLSTQFVAEKVASDEDWSQEEDIAFKDAAGQAFSSLKVRIAKKNSLIANGSSTNSMTGQDGSRPKAARKHSNALSACKYLEDHDIAGMVRHLIASMLQARPDRPVPWLRENYENLMKQWSLGAEASSMDNADSAKIENSSKNKNENNQHGIPDQISSGELKDVEDQEKAGDSTDRLGEEVSAQVLAPTLLEAEDIFPDKPAKRRCDLPDEDEDPEWKSISANAFWSQASDIVEQKLGGGVGSSGANDKSSLLRLLRFLCSSRGDNLDSSATEEASLDETKRWIWPFLQQDAAKSVFRDFSRVVIDQKDSDSFPEWLPQTQDDASGAGSDEMTVSPNYVERGKKLLLMSEGDSVCTNENMFLIESGRFQVVKDGSLVNILERGHIFGEKALLYDMPRQASVYLTSDKCVLWQLSRDCFEDEIKNNADIALPHASKLDIDYAERAMVDSLEIEELLRNYGSDVGDLLIEQPEKKALLVFLSNLWVFQHMTGTGEMSELLKAFQLQEADPYLPTNKIARSSVEALSRLRKPMGLRGSPAAEKSSADGEKKESEETKAVSAEADDPEAPCNLRWPELNEKGQIVWIKEGSPLCDDEALYVIEQGEVDVYQGQQKINVLRAGDVMGELACVFDLPRQATCVISTKTARLWRLDRDSFDMLIRFNDKFSGGPLSNLYYRMYPQRNVALTSSTSADINSSGAHHSLSDQDIFQRERAKLQELLKSLWIFPDLSEDTFQCVLNSFEKEEILVSNRRNSINIFEDGRKYRVLAEGESPSSGGGEYMYVIESGSIEVQQGGEVIRTLKDGDLFGELSLIYGLPRQCSCFVTSQAKTTLWKLNRDAFCKYIADNDDLMAQHSAKYYKVYQLTQRIGEEIQDAIAKSIEETEVAMMNAATNDQVVDCTANLVKSMGLAKDLNLDHTALKQRKSILKDRKSLALRPDAGAQARLATLMKDLWVFKYLAEKERAALIKTLTRVDLNREAMCHDLIKEGREEALAMLEEHPASVPFIFEGTPLGSDAMVYIIERGRFECYSSSAKSKKKETKAGGALVNVLQRGDMFGELGIVFGLPRQATVALSSDTATLWALDYEVFDKYLVCNEAITVDHADEYYRMYSLEPIDWDEIEANKRNADHAGNGSSSADYNSSAADTLEDSATAPLSFAQKTKSEQVSTLRLRKMLQTTWVFRHLTDDQRYELLSLFRRRKLTKSPTLARLSLLEEGETAGEDGGFYIIESGTVSVRRGKSIVNTLGAGDFFGELALIYDISRQASCDLISDHAVLWVLDREHFNEFIRDNHRLRVEHATEYFREYSVDGLVDEPLLSDSESPDVKDQLRDAIIALNPERFHMDMRNCYDLPAEEISALLDEKDRKEKDIQNALKTALQDVKTFNVGDRVPVKEKGRIWLWYIESGSADFFEGFQLVSSKQAGEILGAELIDQDFVSYVSDELRYESGGTASGGPTKMYKLDYDKIRLRKIDKVAQLVDSESFEEERMRDQMKRQSRRDPLPPVLDALPDSLLDKTAEEVFSVESQILSRMAHDPEFYSPRSLTQKSGSSGSAGMKIEEEDGAEGKTTEEDIRKWTGGVLESLWLSFVGFEFDQ